MTRGDGKGPEDSRYVNGGTGWLMRWLKLHPWTVLAALVFAAIIYTYSVNVHRTDDIASVQQQRIHDTYVRNVQLCRFVDADHNRERATIVKQTGETVRRFPNGIDFGGQHYSAKFIYEQAKDQYALPRKTRPRFCYSLVQNPVPPFPSLHDLKHPAKRP